MQSRDNRPQRLSSRPYSIPNVTRKTSRSDLARICSPFFHSITLARRHALKGAQLYLAHFPDDFVGKRLSFRRERDQVAAKVLRILPAGDEPRASSCLSEAEIVCFG